jgi:hypothetical protein
MSEIQVYDEVNAQANAMPQLATAMIVETPEHVTAATNFLGFLATSKKRFEARRTFFVRPLNDQVNAINAAFRSIITPLDTATATLKTKVLAYNREQERFRQEEIKRLQQEEAAKIIDAYISGEEIPLPTVIAPPKAPTMTVGSFGKAVSKKRWTFEVTNLALVPRSYMMVNDQAIRDAIKAGIREIPGVRIYQDEQLAVIRQGVLGWLCSLRKPSSLRPKAASASLAPAGPARHSPPWFWQPAWAGRPH